MQISVSIPNDLRCLYVHCIYTVMSIKLYLLQDRPEFKEIVPILEECKQSQVAALLNNSTVPSMKEEEEGEGEDGQTSPPIAGNVMALRTHWEQEASKNRYHSEYILVLVRL